MKTSVLEVCAPLAVCFKYGVVHINIGDGDMYLLASFVSNDVQRIYQRREPVQVGLTLKERILGLDESR